MNKEDVKNFTYRVKGDDNKIYGPVDYDTILQWYRQGRLEAKSLCSRNEDEFIQLIKLTEFGILFGQRSVIKIKVIKTKTQSDTIRIDDVIHEDSRKYSVKCHIKIALHTYHTGYGFLYSISVIISLVLLGLLSAPFGVGKFTIGSYFVLLIGLLLGAAVYGNMVFYSPSYRPQKIGEFFSRLGTFYRAKLALYIFLRIFESIILLVVSQALWNKQILDSISGKLGAFSLNNTQADINTVNHILIQLKMLLLTNTRFIISIITIVVFLGFAYCLYIISTRALMYLSPTRNISWMAIKDAFGCIKKCYLWLILVNLICFLLFAGLAVLLILSLTKSWILIFVLLYMIYIIPYGILLNSAVMDGYMQNKNQ